MKTRVIILCAAVISAAAFISFSAEACGVKANCKLKGANHDMSKCDMMAMNDSGAKTDAKPSGQGASKGSESLSDVGPGGWKEWRKKNEAKIAKVNYKNHCSACHGEKGDGAGQAADELPLPPRDHTNAAYMKTRTDKQLLNVVLNGGEAEGFDSAMPPHNTVMTNKEARNLVKYLRVLCQCSYEKL
ncbi:MAG: cytochrome c [Nitrospinae bacterium]|nr:cytochrome c [Nitrospinota bacterium]